jgi:hypothetical protein
VNVGSLRKFLLGKPQFLALPTNGLPQANARESGCLWHASLLIS